MLNCPRLAIHLKILFVLHCREVIARRPGLIFIHSLTLRKKCIVRTAEPVGSRHLAENAGLGCSSATIRNELAELVSLGYLEQPHTSAGRVPTPMGYRMYVNELMQQQKYSLEETEELNRATVTLRGGETWTLNRGEDGELRLAGNEDMALDETLTAKIMDALCNIVFEDVLTEDGQEWQTRREEFGLAEPTLIAEARYADGTEIHLRFGDESPMEDVTFCYMEAVGDDRLFAVATSLLTDLRVERALLISVTQPDIHQARLDRITVTDGDGTKTLEWKLQGSIMDQDAAENWLLTAPFVYPADFDTFKSPYKTVIDIVMAADCLDAATDTVGRSYTGSKTPQQIMDEIIKDAGTRYSPDIAEILKEEDLRKEIEHILRSVRRDTYRSTFDLLSYVLAQDHGDFTADRVVKLS